MAILICVQNLAGTGLGVAPKKCKCKFWNINARPAGMYPLCDSYEIVSISWYFCDGFQFSIWLHLLKGFGFYRGFIFGVYVSTIFLCGVTRRWFICSVWRYIIVWLLTWLPTLTFLGRITILHTYMRPLVTDRVAWSVCRSVTLVRPAKTAEPIEMRLGWGLCWLQETMY